MIDAGCRRIAIDAAMAIPIEHLLAKLAPLARGPSDIAGTVAKFDNEIASL